MTSLFKTKTFRRKQNLSEKLSLNVFLVNLPLQNFMVNLISLSVKSDQQDVICIKYLSLNFNNMPSFISLLLKYSYFFLTESFNGQLKNKSKY